jgi:hypothetical protein
VRAKQAEFRFLHGERFDNIAASGGSQERLTARGFDSGTPGAVERAGA